MKTRSFPLVALGCGLFGSAHLSAQSFITLPSFDGTVSALAISGSTLYVGGSFTTVNGATTRNRLAAIDLNTGTLTSWNPGADSTVTTLTVSNDGTTVYAGGSFTNIGGGGTGATARVSLAAVNTTTGAATSWNPNPNAFTNISYMTISAGGTVYVTGDFTTLDGGNISRSGLAGIQANGTITSFAPSGGTANGARGLAVSGDGNTVYLVNQSSFTWDAVGGGTTSQRGIMAFQASDGLLTSFNPAATQGGFGTNSFAVLTNGNDLYIGGNFDTISGADRNRIVKYTNEVLDTTFDASVGGNSGPSGTARRFALVDGVLYMIGDFSTYDGTARVGLAAINPITGALLASWDGAGTGTGNDSQSSTAFAASSLGVYFGDPNMTQLLGQNVTGLNLAGLTVTAIPEPSTYAAVFGALGLAAAGIVRRRHSSQRAA